MDTRRFGVELGDPAGQQLWEALSCLTAVRAWLPRWSESRLRLEVRGDSVSMLALVVALRPKGAGLALIARELALCAAQSPYTPVVGAHNTNSDETGFISGWAGFILVLGEVASGFISGWAGFLLVLGEVASTLLVRGQHKPARTLICLGGPNDAKQ